MGKYMSGIYQGRKITFEWQICKCCTNVSRLHASQYKGILVIYLSYKRIHSE